MAKVLASTTQVKCISPTWGLEQDKTYNVLSTFTPRNGCDVTEIKLSVSGYPEGKWYDAYRFEPVMQEPFKDLVKENLRKYIEASVNRKNDSDVNILSSLARSLGFTVETTTIHKVIVS